MTIPCRHELHELYPLNCPGCNPDGYAAMLSHAPQGQPGMEQAEISPTRRVEPQATHDQAYTDRY